MLTSYESIVSPIGPEPTNQKENDFSCLRIAELAEKKLAVLFGLSELRVSEPTHKRKNASSYHVWKAHIQDKSRELREIRDEIEKERTGKSENVFAD